MDRIITRENLLSLTRKISNTITDDRLNPIIREVEQSEIKPQIGDAMLEKVRAYVNGESTVNDAAIIEDKPTEIIPIAFLYEGGQYDYCGTTYTLSGLKHAIANYVYAHLIYAQDNFLGNAGLVGQSDLASAAYKLSADKKNQYLTVKGVAESYMQECLLYMRRNPEYFNLCKTTYRRKKTITIL